MPADLRVLAGPSPNSLTDVSDKVNTNETHRIVSGTFEGVVSLQIKRFPTHHRTTSSDYFERPDRQGITWSIQVQGLSILPIFSPSPVPDHQSYSHVTVQADFFNRKQPMMYCLGTYSNVRSLCPGVRAQRSSS